jgi:hypothetical protein
MSENDKVEEIPEEIKNRLLKMISFYDNLIQEAKDEKELIAQMVINSQSVNKCFTHKIILSVRLNY